MAIGDRPPPRKIRRRNALTVQDPHYPHVVPPPNSPVRDPFEDSSRMQALDENVRRDFTIEDDNDGKYFFLHTCKLKLSILCYIYSRYFL